MIRKANEGDVRSIVRMGRNFIGTTGYQHHIVANDVQMEVLVRHLIDADNTTLFVADNGDGPIGMIGCTLFNHPVSGELTASEVFWWVEPNYRGIGVDLYNKFHEWAKRHDAVKIQMGAPANTRVGKFYERLGFVEVETLYQKEVR